MASRVSSNNKSRQIQGNHKRAPLSLREVSKRAALASKRKIWDSNDEAIEAAQSAVDLWENAYNGLRGILGMGFRSAKGFYGAAKAGAHGLEHGLLVPVRDWLLLPAFGGVEFAVDGTIGFLQSPQAAQVAHHSMEVVKRVPFVGEAMLAPALVMSVEATQKAWEIVQYPIPSRLAVRDSVDRVLTTTKWVLGTAGREIYYYAKRMDASITRTLMHTQWHVLGSGPYATLDKLNKLQVLDHLCERYFSLTDVFARYELACHVRGQNRQLYRDLVLSGLLKERGGELTAEDEWLSSEPSYRYLEREFLLGVDDGNVHALFFRLPHVNGQRPTKDVTWVRMKEDERRILERRYQELAGVDQSNSKFLDAPFRDTSQQARKYPTIAKWYDVGSQDILIDQQRHAISFFPSCYSCRKPLEWQPPMKRKAFGDLCDSCSSQQVIESIMSLPTPITIVMRPTLWRFHGQGDDVVRAVWCLDTNRGLQPYAEESSAVLEDAYLFLRWKASQSSSGHASVDSMEGALLTVQVTSPDGSEQQLIQFTSPTEATAVQKTLGGALSIFKRRVYRGIRQHEANDDVSDEVIETTFEQDVTGKCDDIDFGGDDVSLQTVENEGGKGNFVVPTERLDSREIPLETLAYVEPPTIERGSDSSSNDESADHLVLIIHGIGEMLRSIDVFGMSLPNLSSIVDCAGFLRKNHAEIQKAQASLTSLSGRVEYLPVEWHEAFALQSQRGSSGIRNPTSAGTSPTVHDISLRTIPQMREFANDTLMDVLYFMSPQHHDVILDIVITEMNVVVEKFRSLTGFTGNVSIIGHSLGSIISWDILSNTKCRPQPSRYSGLRRSLLYNDDYCDDEVKSAPNPSTQTDPSVFESVREFDGVVALASPSSSSQEKMPFCAEEGGQDIISRPLSEQSTTNTSLVDDAGINNDDGPNVPMVELAFNVENTFMLGSPVAVFLMIRNQQDPLKESFRLPGCNRVFNIFHPYDPVAYRLEPLLHVSNSKLSPRIISHWNGGYRVQYHTKRIWKQIVDETMKTQRHVCEAVESQMSRMGLLDDDSESNCSSGSVHTGSEGGGGLSHRGDDDDDDNKSLESGWRDPITGSLNRGDRIDYMLQEKEIELSNEYVAALAAHSSYWGEKDLSLFIAKQIVRSNLESATLDREMIVPPDECVDL